MADLPSRGKWREFTHTGGVRIDLGIMGKYGKIHPNIPQFPWSKTLNERVNKILKLSELECGAPWELYVETAFPALLHAYLTAIAPGKVDILKSRLNHSYNCGFKKIFRELDKVLPNPAKKATSFLFRYAGPLFHINYIYFLADVETEFVLNWETAVIQRQQCTPSPIGGPCQLSSASNNVVIPNSFFPMNWRQRDNDPSGWAGPFAPWNVVTPGKISGYKCYSAGSFRNSTTIDQAVTYQITDVTGTMVAGPTTITVGAGQSGSVTIYGQTFESNPANASFQATYAISPGGAAGVQATGGSFTVAAL